MECEKVYKNQNYMYEYKLFGKWCPCHIITDMPAHLFKKGYCDIYNAYGSVDSVQNSRIRKMSKTDYIKYRNESKKWLGNALSVRLGFRETEKEDLALWGQTNDFEKILEQNLST